MTEFPSDDLPDWDLLAGNAERAPAGIEYVPAGAIRDLRGRRAMIGVPGLGWRDDLRIDDTVIQASRTYVPVLPEHEWYRAEAEQTEVFAPLVPLERVWVERTSSTVTPTEATDLVARLISLDAPPARPPRRAKDVMAMTGLRVVRVAGPDDKTSSDERDLRAVTEPYNSAEGDICIRVCRELDWYRWAWSGQAPKTLEVPIHLLWVE
ncbi:hypothetical protein Drose_02630 [Dactylosporangium roseum]|uniref:Uncharacterized protein n=1 Tax=Dactylosporangium roseum TaxID=47989 RepID=A0ABY5Z589_9ACTN|nr:hypothetical protein Drose_02630 [Dactylosporangium roseum]